MMEEEGEWGWGTEVTDEGGYRGGKIEERQGKKMKGPG
jgi:hypothetical protein